MNPLHSRKSPRGSSFGRAACLVLVLVSAARAQGSLRHAFLGENPGDEFGTAVNTAGDVNKDGFGDIIVGAPFSYALLGHPGSAMVFSGVDGSVLQVLVGTQPNQFFGLGVGTAGDVDGDGTLDTIIGLSANNSTGLGPGGGARIVSGLTGVTLHTFAGTNLNDGFGQTVAALGDVNADDVPDVLVGTAIAPGASIAGYARVFSGATGAILYHKAGTFIGQRYGQAFTAGDVNGDGVSDFMIGAIGNNVNGSNSGSAFVYSGATGALLRTVHGVSANNQLGYSGGTVGDVNADGFDDFIVGTFIPAGTGYARVYSGVDGSVLFHVTDGAVADAYGHSVAGIGDANGDGTPDFAVAGPNSSVGGTFSGRVRVLSGVDGSLLREFVGTPGIRLGYCLNPAGDVNGDHLMDLAIGTLVPGSTGQPGQAQVVSICAAQQYGGGLLPTQTLSMSWILGGPGHESEGGIAISGSSPGSGGVVAGNVAPGEVVYYDVPVLVDLSPANLILLDVIYDGNGYLEFPLDLQNPALDGVNIYVQAFEYNQGASSGIFASNGLMVLFGK